MAFRVRDDRVEYLLVGVPLVAALGVSSLLPLTLLQSGLLVTLAALVAVVAVVPGVRPTLYRKTGVRAGAWLLAVAVAAGGIGLTYLVGDPRPFCDSTVHRGCLTTYGTSAAVFLGSSLGVAVAAGHLGRYLRVRNSTVGPASEVSEGLVAVEGRVVPAGDTVDGPVSGEPTVWYRSAVERGTPFDGHLEVERETAGESFYVEDGSGRLLVLADGLDPHDVSELARSHTGDGGGRRLREWSYSPDDVVTVVGRASEVSRGRYPEPVAVGLGEPVLVGRGTREELLGWAARRVLVGGGLALGVGGISLFVMVLTA